MNRYDEAEKAYRKVVEIDEKDAWAWGALGLLLHYKLGRYGEAEKVYRKAIEIDENSAPAWALLGLFLHEQPQRYAEAEKAYRNAVEIDEKYARAWARLGQLLHEKLDRYEEAEKAYRKAVEIDDKYGWAWGALGLLLHHKLGRYDEAEKAYRKAIEVDPHHQMARGELFKLLLSEPGRTEEALRLAEEYLGEHPKDALVLNNLAWAVYKHGRQDLLPKAEAWAEEAVALDPNSGSYLHTVASILVARGKMDEALEHARSYLEDRETVEETIDDGINLFVGIAAAGYAAEALDIVRNSPSAEILEPLVVGLRLYAGEDVKAAAEIMEVGKDVVKRIKQRQEEMDSPSSLP
jgi:tetratricopeptide (TPR) repeat protein